MGGARRGLTPGGKPEKISGVEIEMYEKIEPSSNKSNPVVSNMSQVELLLITYK
jgi:hypothetical protein